MAEKNSSQPSLKQLQDEARASEIVINLAYYMYIKWQYRILRIFNSLNLNKWNHKSLQHLYHPFGKVQFLFIHMALTHRASMRSLKSETNHLARDLTSSLTTFPPKPMKASAGGQASRSVAPSPIRIIELYL